MLIDTHCHLHDREFFSSAQVEEMLKRARDAGVEAVICIGTNLEDSLAAQDFAAKATFPKVHWTMGIHPEFAKNRHQATELAKNMREKLEKIYERLGKNRKSEIPPVGIGEVGLDYHYEGYSQIAQIRLFEEMLQLASDFLLPVSLHVREAFSDFFPIAANFPKLRGVVHSFSDNKKSLKRILNETEFFVGVNGLATYSTLPTPPLERIVLETDAPFLTPKPFRGMINESSYVREVATWLAEKLGLDPKIIEEKTTNNARRIFNI